MELSLRNQMGDIMNDVELESLLEEAGYQYDPINERYITAGDETEFTTEEVADQLEIPLEDLLRWEAEQESQEDFRQ